MADLLRDGTIDPWTAAHIWAALARRQSLSVIGGQSGIGKTTLLTALCELLPPETRRVYIRGCYEDFAFLRDPRIDPRHTALMVNELSPHLPVYLWGPGVAEVFEATRQGFMVLATAHAQSALEFVGSLTGGPLRLPPTLVAAIAVVVGLGIDPETSRRRATGVWRLQKTRRGISVDRLASSPHQRERATSADEWFPAPEIDTRARLLAELMTGSGPLPHALGILAVHNHDCVGDGAP